MIYDLMYINYSKNIIEIFKYRENDEFLLEFFQTYN